MESVAYGFHAVGEFGGVGDQTVVGASVAAGGPAVVEDYLG